MTSRWQHGPWNQSISLQAVASQDADAGRAGVAVTTRLCAGFFLCSAYREHFSQTKVQVLWLYEEQKGSLTEVAADQEPSKFSLQVLARLLCPTMLVFSVSAVFSFTNEENKTEGQNEAA